MRDSSQLPQLLVQRRQLTPPRLLLLGEASDPRSSRGGAAAVLCVPGGQEGHRLRLRPHLLLHLRSSRQQVPAVPDAGDLAAGCVRMTDWQQVPLCIIADWQQVSLCQTLVTVRLAVYV